MNQITKENLSLELKAGVALLQGPCTLTELSQRLGLDKRATGRAIDVLMDQGQIKEGWTRRDNGHYREIRLCDVAVPFFEKVKEKVGL